MNSYFQEGVDARWRGESFFRNPYRPLTAAYDLWAEGWHSVS